MASDTMSIKRPGWVFPSGLRPLVERFSDDLPAVSVLIDHHTRFPLYSKFLTAAESDVLREHHAGRAMGGIAGFLGTSHSARGRMAMCPECMATDTKENGYSFWRRLFLTPGLFACPTHERLLLTFCDACQAGHRRNRNNWWPTERCHCGGSLQPVAQLDSQGIECAIGIAKMAGDILRSGGPAELSNAILCEAINSSLGLDELSSMRQGEKVLEAFEQKIGSVALRAMGFGFLTAKRFGKESKRVGYIRNPIQNLAAIFAIFGSFKGFSSALQSGSNGAENRSLASSAGSEFKTSRRKRKSELSIDQYIALVSALPRDEIWKLNFKYREWLLKLMIENPGIQRSNLRGLPGKKAALQHLRHIDSDWYDKTLPARPKMLRAEQELLLIQEIRTVASQIHLQYERLIKKSPMLRITKTRLLSNIRSESNGGRAIRSQEIQELILNRVRESEQRRARLIELQCERTDRAEQNSDAQHGTDAIVLGKESRGT